MAREILATFKGEICIEDVTVDAEAIYEIETTEYGLEPLKICKAYGCSVWHGNGKAKNEQDIKKIISNRMLIETEIGRLFITFTSIYEHTFSFIGCENPILDKWTTTEYFKEGQT